MVSNKSQNQSSASVPSNTEAQESSATVGQYKMSKAETISIIAMEILVSILGISVVSSFSFQYTWGLVIGLALIVFAVVTLTVSDIIHNRIKVVTGAIVIGLAVLTIVIMMVIGISKSGI